MALCAARGMCRVVYRDRKRSWQPDSVSAAISMRGFRMRVTHVHLNPISAYRCNLIRYLALAPGQGRNERANSRDQVVRALRWTSGCCCVTLRLWFGGWTPAAAFRLLSALSTRLLTHWHWCCRGTDGRLFPLGGDAEHVRRLRLTPGMISCGAVGPLLSRKLNLQFTKFAQ
jgi:hypothetical protein